MSTDTYRTFVIGSLASIQANLTDGATSTTFSVLALLLFVAAAGLWWTDRRKPDPPARSSRTHLTVNVSADTSKFRDQIRELGEDLRRLT